MLTCRSNVEQQKRKVIQRALSRFRLCRLRVIRPRTLCLLRNGIHGVPDPGWKTNKRALYGSLYRNVRYCASDMPCIQVSACVPNSTPIRQLSSLRSCALESSRLQDGTETWDISDWTLPRVSTSCPLCVSHPMPRVDLGRALHRRLWLLCPGGHLHPALGGTAVGTWKTAASALESMVQLFSVFLARCGVPLVRSLQQRSTPNESLVGEENVPDYALVGGCWPTLCSRLGRRLAHALAELWHGPRDSFVDTQLGGRRALARHGDSWLPPPPAAVPPRSSTTPSSRPRRHSTRTPLVVHAPGRRFQTSCCAAPLPASAAGLATTLAHLQDKGG